MAGKVFADINYEKWNRMLNRSRESRLKRVKSFCCQKEIEWKECNCTGLIYSELIQEGGERNIFWKALSYSQRDIQMFSPDCRLRIPQK